MTMMNKKQPQEHRQESMKSLMRNSEREPEINVTQCIGGWVGLRAGLDGCGKYRLSYAGSR